MIVYGIPSEKQIVFNWSQVGRVPIDAPKVTGHGRPVLDIEWNPFNDQQIASSSEDDIHTDDFN